MQTVIKSASSLKRRKLAEEAPSNHPLFKAALLEFEAVNRTKVFQPKKYFAGQKAILSEELEALHLLQPDLPIKSVIVHVLQELPDFLPAANLVEVTLFVVEQWEKLKLGIK